jgi:endonuclease/exonuclease/phosphatase family metal-dependent hydrolase
MAIKEEKEEENNINNINPPSYMKNHKLKICCLTWNMHGLLPSQEQLKQLLDPHKNKKFDIYALGSEECQRSILKSLIKSDKSDWEEKLKDYFGNDYALISSETLCAIHLAIFVRSTLIENISKVKVNTVKTGAKNLLGNKGAVGISFNIFNLSIMIINCHLAALQGRSDQRNIDFERCVTQMDSNYQNFDFIILMGDLNYRLNNLNIDMNMIQEDHLLFLKYDQLEYEINLKRINLLGFREGRIYFKPTFKYWNNTSNFQYIDTHDIDQAPAWTDRILYKKNENGNNYLDVRQEKYDSMHNIEMSDHKPVYSYFTLNFD